MKIYLAGPLFTTAEYAFNAELAKHLRGLGHDVFNPQEEEVRGKSAKQIFMADVAAIDWCNAIVANMDGPDPDSGTCWECGYGFAKGKIVGLYRTDFRNSSDHGEAMVNLMMVGGADFSLRLNMQPPKKIAAMVHAKLAKLAGRKKKK